MAKRKPGPPHASEKAAPAALPPVAPPKKNAWLLGLSLVLLVVWLCVLALLALFGEAQFGQ